MERHILALDQGTSSSRAILFDHAARPVAVSQREIETRYPQPGWVEQDAAALASTQISAARDVLAQAGLGPEAVAAIGITNQRETTVAWDERGQPLAPAIVWQDRRTASRCAELRSAGREAAIRARTGLLLDPYFSATKMAWLLDSIPDGHARAAGGALRVGTVDAWLLWQLTGGSTFATDTSNASRTMLLDLDACEWDRALLDLFGVPVGALPEVRPTDADFGLTLPGVLGAQVPIAAVVGDQQSSLFGQACWDEGEAKATYGTGCFLLMSTGAHRRTAPAGLLSTAAWTRRAGDAGTTYALEGSVFVAGAVVQWLRDGLGIIASAAEVEPLASSVADSAGVVFVPAFAGLGAPYWDPDARGIISGLTAGVTRGHLARAALESIAHQTADLVDTLAVAGGTSLRLLRVDGGAARNDLLLQLQADLLGCPVQRAAVAETTALGAALLAGRSVGYWTDDAEVRSLVGDGELFEPRASESWRRSMREQWADAVLRSRSHVRGESA
jgi:glycerol kinase